MNSFLDKISSNHSTLGKLTINSHREIKTSSQNHLILNFTDGTKTEYELDIVQDLTKIEMEKIANSNLLFIKQLYQSKPTPYSGMVSQSLKCNSDLYPQEIIVKLSNHNQKILIAPLGKNKQFGSCQKDQVFFWSCNSYYQQNKTLINIKIISPSKKILNCESRIKDFIVGYVEK